MDIFKLGDKILDLLNVIFAFWNSQVSLVFELLGQSPTAFKDGGPWAVIEGLEPIFVAIGSSLVVLFFVSFICGVASTLLPFPHRSTLLFHTSLCGLYCFGVVFSTLLCVVLG